jgi:hypothetical protein
MNGNLSLIGSHVYQCYSLLYLRSSHAKRVSEHAEVKFMTRFTAKHDSICLFFSSSSYFIPISLAADKVRMPKVKRPIKVECMHVIDPCEQETV